MRRRMLWWLALALISWANASAADKARLAVLDLVPVEFDADEASLLSQQLRYELRAMKRFGLVTRDDLYAMVVGKGLHVASCDDSCLEALGRSLGARWMVAGTIRLRDDEVRIEAQLYDVERGFAFSRITRKADYDLERLQKREMKRLAEELVPPDEGGGVPWWLLVLGGAGGAWFATQGGGSGDAAGDGPRNARDPADPNDPLQGTADIVGTFADE